MPHCLGVVIQLLADPPIMHFWLKEPEEANMHICSNRGNEDCLEAVYFIFPWIQVKYHFGHVSKGEGLTCVLFLE